MNRHLLFILFALISLHSFAQDITDEDFLPLRPEHIYEYSESGVRRLPSKIGSRSTAALACMGSPKVPVILVQFADRPFYAAGKTKTDIVNTYNLFFNGDSNDEVYKAIGSKGSVKTYFKDQSLDQFSPDFQIIGPVTLNKSYKYYGKNKDKTKDTGIREFYAEALTQSIDEFDIDWSVFDNNKDGRVDMVFFIHSGWGENTVIELDPDAIWAKESTTSLSVPKNDSTSVVFACYAVCAEARLKSSTQFEIDKMSGIYGPTCYNPDNLKVDGIGVCVHELSHALGLPDFYDTNNEAFGMDIWSIMDYGEYANNGYTPGNYDAYERDFMGWQSLVELTDTCILVLPCFEDGGVGYKIVNEANEDEYYIIENRQPKGWDEKLCKKGRGLQVTHVDYNAASWNNNSVNTRKEHQRMTIIAANNNYTGTNVSPDNDTYYKCLEGNLFPYILPSQSLTSATIPAQYVYAGTYMNKPIYDITQNEDGTITLYYLKAKEEYDKEFETSIREADEYTKIDVYSLNGMHICTCLPNEVKNLTYLRGLYIFKFDNGKVHKVLFK